MTRFIAGAVLGVLLAATGAYAYALYVNLDMQITMNVSRKQLERAVERRCEVTDDGFVSCRSVDFECSASETVEVDESVSLTVSCDAE